MIPIGKTAFIGFIVAAATCLGMSASGSKKNGKTLTFLTRKAVII